MRFDVLALLMHQKVFLVGYQCHRHELVVHEIKAVVLQMIIQL